MSVKKKDAFNEIPNQNKRLLFNCSHIFKLGPVDGFYNCLQVSKIFSHSERIKINNTLTALVHERGQAEGTHQF